LVVIVAMACACAGPNYSADEARRLGEAASELAPLRVTEFRDQDWCANISYGRGSFSRTDSHSTCDLFAETAVAFDAQAEQDFAAVHAILSRHGVSPTYFELDYGSGSTNPISGYFEVGCGDCEFGRYVLSAEAPSEDALQVVPGWWWVQG
jgi:hypothetical protein